MSEIAFSEPKLRVPVNPVTYAKCLRRIVKKHGINFVAEKINKSKEWIKNKMQVTQIPEEMNPEIDLEEHMKTALVNHFIQHANEEMEIYNKLLKKVVDFCGIDFVAKKMGITKNWIEEKIKNV